MKCNALQGRLETKEKTKTEEIAVMTHKKSMNYKGSVKS